MRTRTISVSHLVFGLIFLGAAVLWSIGAATDADAPDLAVVAPAVLIGAGVAGLIAMVVNARNTRIRTGGRSPEPVGAEPVGTEATATEADPPRTDNELTHTTVLDPEEKP
jgi:hypothetical protein